MTMSRKRQGTRLTHADAEGRVRMVDVGEKPVTHRVCVARGAVRMATETLRRITEGRMPKGEVLAEGDEAETEISAHLDMQLMADWREQIPCFNDRRPELY